MPNGKHRYVLDCDYDIIDINACARLEAKMASITIRNLNEKLKTQLRIEAAKNGHSMEEEVRIILKKALSQSQKGGLGSRIKQRFAEAEGIELEVPPRFDSPRDPGFGS